MAGQRASFGATKIIVATICAMLAVAPAIAENVPLPTPRPKTDVTPPPPDTAPPEQQDDGQKHFFPFSFLQKGLGIQTTTFNPQQRALLDRVSAYLSSVQTMVGNFVQIGPDGSRTQGTFYIQKPGKVRFDYSPPSPLDIVADGSSVVVRDRKLDTQQLYPLSQTPLRYLLADHINLIQDTDVISVSSDDTFVSVVIEEKQLVVGTNRLMLMFDAKDLTLKQWTVTDPQGLDTTVSIYNLNSKKKPDPNLFVIDYQRAPGIGNQ